MSVSSTIVLPLEFLCDILQFPLIFAVSRLTMALKFKRLLNQLGNHQRKASSVAFQTNERKSLILPNYSH